MSHYKHYTVRILSIILVLLFAGCQLPKKEIDFTFYKWSIHQSYYLKFNQTDTLYFINTYPFEEQTSFAILNEKEREEIESILNTLSFPTIEKFRDRSVEDGKTFAFILNRNEEHKKLEIHEEAGPKQFWSFGERLEEIKTRKKFTVIKKKFDLKEMDSITIGLPPTIE